MFLQDFAIPHFSIFLNSFLLIMSGVVEQLSASLKMYWFLLCGYGTGCVIPFPPKHPCVVSITSFCVWLQLLFLFSRVMVLYEHYEQLSKPT